MPYVLLCRDKPGALQVRLDNRPAHLEFLKERDAVLMAAGPFLDNDDKMIGSLLILDVPDEAAALAFAAADPYSKAGLFEHVEARRWRWAVKAPKA